jgi:flagellar basal body-associated protein FliL
MKKSIVILSLALAATSVTVAAATFVTSNSKQAELERAARMENLSVVAVKNGNYELACKAQTQVVDALTKIRVNGQDLVGSAVAQKDDLCRKAAVSAMNEYRFLAG